MSVYFVSGANEFWNPASLTAEVFVRQVQVLEGILCLPSGLSPVVADEVTVDRAKFSAFASECGILLERLRSAAGARALLDGTFATVFALAHRIGVAGPESPLVRVLREQAAGWM